MANDQVQEAGTRQSLWGNRHFCCRGCASLQKGGENWGVEQRRVKRTGPTDEIQKSDGMGNSCQMRSSRLRNR